jgi:hypothetical protein
MAGTIVANTLNTDTVGGVFTTQNAVTGIAKAWAQFTATGGTVTINGSFNVSSITRSSTGIYVVNFTTAMPNINYSVVAPTSFVSASNYTATVPFVSNGPSVTTATPTTTSFNLATVSIATGNPSDPTYVNFAVFSS